jgi:glycosyltransferase involved in cell wall biosynthesis
MKILYDDQIFSMMTHGGVSRYHYELMKQLNILDIDTELSVFFSNNYYLRNKDVSSHYSSLPFNLKIFNKTFPKYNRRFSIKKIKDHSFDIFHPTSYSDYFFDALQKKPFVITVHDMITEIYEKNNSINLIKKELITKADKIIAVSKHTKNDILNFTSIEEDKIDVIYHGSSFAPANCIDNNKIGNRPYFLYVGGRQNYKNFDFLLKTFSVFSLKYDDVLLLCTGSDFSKKEKGKISELSLNNKVKSVTAKNDIEMSQLYSQAIALIFPSLYEGFGMPILEAFSCKCPVLLSDSSCFPEIALNAGLYFDPTDIDSLFEKMSMIFEDEVLRRDLIKKGIQRSTCFSWSDTAKNTLQTYNSVL